MTHGTIFNETHLLNVTTLCYLAGPTDYYMKLADKPGSTGFMLIMDLPPPLPESQSGMDAYMVKWSRCELTKLATYIILLHLK